MRFLKILAMLLAIYLAIVVAFESLLGYFQPANERTIVISTTDDQGNTNDRVVSLLETDGNLYVAANHWPRDWYHDALERPDVDVTREGERQAYRAIPVIADEHDRVNSDNATGVIFKLLTGFPPRYFLRLEPKIEPQ